MVPGGARGAVVGGLLGGAGGAAIGGTFGLIGGALEILFGFAYAFYIAKAGDGGAYLAGLAVIGVTMIGLYLFTLALLVGAVVNRKLARGVETCPGAAAESTVDD